MYTARLTINRDGKPIHEIDLGPRKHRFDLKADIGSVAAAFESCDLEEIGAEFGDDGEESEE